MYLFAEPARLAGKEIGAEDMAQHRDEVEAFGRAVAGAEVSFHSSSYRDWIGTWRRSTDEVVAHGQRLIEAFGP